MNSLKEQTIWRTQLKDGEYTIQGKRGQIAQYSDDDLDVWVKNLRAANRVEKFWGAKNHYDDGAVFVRPFSDLKLAGQFIKARKKRLVTEARRLWGRELAKRWGYSKGHAFKNGSLAKQSVENGSKYVIAEKDEILPSISESAPKDPEIDPSAG